MIMPYTSPQLEKLQWLRNRHYEPISIDGDGGWNEEPIIVRLDRNAFGRKPLKLKILPTGEHSNA